ncbi:hypothetical protein INS49_006390 [Diaporthe citri]|uniref:uncharacterized protein n=1 Tax=Diaporthe citri TaxID=83186 RepID=UPI001C7F4C87|nr:uncharacterized protein INS49_006390 [Diaporthe citri]KAG6364786.1 hypothetical protein INS49_006390 [Diaporthe citri]
MAAAGDDCHYGLPGVSKCARQVLDPFILDDALTFGLCPAPGPHWQYGAWCERGWTFQETYLSRRRLFSDGLNAFLGLANAMQDLHLPIYNVAGVPFLVGNNLKRTNRDYWAETSFSLDLRGFQSMGWTGLTNNMLSTVDSRPGVGAMSSYGIFVILTLGLLPRLIGRLEKGRKPVSASTMPDYETYKSSSPPTVVIR